MSKKYKKGYRDGYIEATREFASRLSDFSISNDILSLKVVPEMTHLLRDARERPFESWHTFNIDDLARKEKEKEETTNTEQGKIHEALQSIPNDNRSLAKTAALLENLAATERLNLMGMGSPGRLKLLKDASDFFYLLSEIKSGK